MEYKEYAEEKGHKVELAPLRSGNLDRELHTQAHQALVIAVHDVFIFYRGGILLVTRDNEPMKESLWCIGGRLQRGIPAEESLKIKTKQECGLELEGITFLGVDRTYFSQDPFEHGKGTDTLGLVYFAYGKGTLQLDSLHKQPRIITFPDYTPALREKLHPYLQKYMDIAFKKLDEKDNADKHS